jgi:hypothetical protein
MIKSPLPVIWQGAIDRAGGTGFGIFRAWPPVQQRLSKAGIPPCADLP